MGTKNSRSTHTFNTGTLFKMYALGVSTNRDPVVYSFDHQKLMEQISQFIEEYNVDVSRWIRAGHPKDIDNFVRYEKIKWSEHLKGELKRGKYGSVSPSHFRTALYRPFCRKWLYCDFYLIIVLPHSIRICLSLLIKLKTRSFVLPELKSKRVWLSATDNIPSLDLAFEKTHVSPTTRIRRMEATSAKTSHDWALARFQAKYWPHVTKWDIFQYVYAMLHHPQYRERYTENLKRDLPHIPLLHGKEAFQDCVRIGRQ